MRKTTVQLPILNSFGQQLFLQSMYLFHVFAGFLNPTAILAGKEKGYQDASTAK